MPNVLHYYRTARAFVDSPPSGTIVKLQGTGDILLFDPRSANFAAIDNTGTLKTFFRPSKRSATNLNGFSESYDTALDFF